MGSKEFPRPLDKKKEEYCIKNNIPLIRIPYTRYQELCIEDLQIDTSEYL